jgi:hypothetical protein
MKFDLDSEKHSYLSTSSLAKPDIIIMSFDFIIDRLFVTDVKS